MSEARLAGRADLGTKAMIEHFYPRDPSVHDRPSKESGSTTTKVVVVALFVLGLVAVVTGCLGAFRQPQIAALLKHTGCVVVASVGAGAVVVAIAIAYCTKRGTLPAPTQYLYNLGNPYPHLIHPERNYTLVEQVAPLDHDADVQAAATALLLRVNEIAFLIKRAAEEDAESDYFFAYHNATGVKIFQILEQAPSTITQPVCYRTRHGIVLATNTWQQCVFSVDPNLTCRVSTGPLDKMIEHVEEVLTLPAYVRPSDNVQRGVDGRRAALLAARGVDRPNTFSVVLFAGAATPDGLLGYWVGSVVSGRENVLSQVAIPMYNSYAAAEAAGAKYDSIYLEQGMWCVPGGRRQPHRIVMDRRQDTSYFLINNYMTSVIIRAWLSDQETLARADYHWKPQLSELSDDGDFTISETPGADGAVTRQVFVKIRRQTHVYQVTERQAHAGPVGDPPTNIFTPYRCGIILNAPSSIVLFDAVGNELAYLTRRGIFCIRTGHYAVKSLVQGEIIGVRHSIFVPRFDVPPHAGELRDQEFGLSSDGTTLYVQVGHEMRTAAQVSFVYDITAGTVSHRTATGAVLTLPGNDATAFMQAIDEHIEDE
ncbi:MAG: hypothetical protein ACKVOH_05675 [Chlamydiales bacterium]